MVVLNGRHAGKKGVVISSCDSGTKERKFGHCLVLGVSSAPKKVTRAMSKKKIDKRSRAKPFLKHINYNHVLPTRHQIHQDIIDPKSVLASIKETNGADEREERKLVKPALEDLLTEKFLRPVTKTGKVSKDTLFLRKKICF